MLRSTKESDDEVESKTGRIQTRMLSSHMVNSPLRRSSRIKQAKTSPGSESDTSNHSQSVRVTRQRTATMDSIASEIVKKRLTRHTSVSSDLNEATDFDVETPTKRRLSKNSATPTKTRAANKRLTRAGSEANSPPHVKITRKTRSSSVEPESLQEQKSQLDTPIRIRRRASMLPSSSPVKEEIEEGSATSKLNPTITEIDELTSIDKIAVVPVLLKSDELLSLSQNKSKIQGEQVTMNKKEKTVVEGQSSSEESLLCDISISDEKSADNNSSNLLESNKEENPKENLLQVEQSLIDMCQNSPTKNLTEKSFNEEEKRSNKENQTSNIMSDASPETNAQPFISNISLSTKQSLASAFVSKSDEKEKKETNEISLTNQTETTQEKNVSKKNLDPNVIIEDSNEMNLILEEQSSDRHENETPLNVTNSDDENSEKQSNVMDKQSATDDKINNDTVQDDAFDNADSTKQEQNLSEHVTKSQPKSSNILTIDLESDSDASNTITQNNQSFDITETSEKPAVDTSEDNVLESSQPALSQEAKSKDSFSTKSNVERKSDDVFEAEEKSSQLEKNKDQETADKDPEVDIAIKLFRDISADEWKKKNDEDDDNGSVNSNCQSEKESKQESDAECDLILVDKQAWLAAKDIKEQEEKDSFEYDSDDTVLLKSQTDAVRANCEAKNLDIVSEESVDMDSKKDEEVEEIKKRKSLTKKRSISKRNKDSLPECIDDEDISVTVVKPKMSLNRSNNSSTSGLNNSGQAAKATRQTHENLDEEAEEDANELNRSSQVKKNVSLRKSTDKRKSLNKSLMSTSSNQVENNVQRVSINKSQMDISEEDNTDAHMEKSLKRTKCSLNKSRDDETVVDTECEKDLSNKDNKNASLNRSINKKSKMMQIEISDDDESECSDKMAPLKNYSTIAHAGTDTDNHSASNSIESLDIPRLFNESSNNDDTDANSINSDVKKEYNLDGKKQKFSDDNVAGDECRASESEHSDSDDDGSDLASFIVSDDKVEDENDEEEEEDDQSMKKDDENLENEEVVTEKDEVENKDGEDEQRIEEDVENEEEDVEHEEEDVEIVSEVKNKIVSDGKVEDEGEEEDDDDDQSMKKDDESLEDEEIVTEKNEVESKDEEDEQRIEEDDENEEMDVEIMSEVENKDDKNIKKEVDVEIVDKPTVYKNKKLFASNLKSCIESSTPKHSAVKQTCWISGPLETPSPDLHPALFRKDTWYSGTKKAGKNTFEKSKIPILKGNTSLKEFNTGNKEEKLNRSLPSNLPDAKIKKAPVVKSEIETNLARLYKTMNISDDDVSTIRHLRKEKLSESVPIRVDTKIIPLKKKSLLRKETKNTTQMEIKGKNNEEEVSNLPSTDDATQKHGQRKKHKRQAGEVLNENITDRDQKVIESKTKTEVANRSPMLTVKDATGKNLEQVKKKKKRKQIDVIEQSENVGEDDAADSKLVAQKKKKLVQHTTMLITKGNNSKDSDQINEKRKKKKKKQTGIIEQEENINEDKKNVRRNETELAQRNKKKAGKTVSSLERDLFTDDYIGAKKKRKEKEILKNEETLSEELTKNIAQIKTKKKIHKQDTYNRMMPISDDTVQKRQKKRKRQVEEPLDENIDEVVSQDLIETKRKVKRVKFFTTEQEIKFPKQREPVTKDDIYENLDQINEERKKKKKKQVAVTEQDNTMNEDDTYAPKLVGEKKKKKKKKQLDVNQRDNISEEDTCAVKTISELFTCAQSSNNPAYAFKRATSHPILKNENFLSSQLGLVDNTKITDLHQIIEKKKKKKKKKQQFHAIEQDNNIIEDDTYAPEPVGEKKKKKKKQLAVIEQDYNIEDDTYAPEPVGEKKKKKKKQQQLGISQQDNNINEEDTYALEAVEKKKKKKKKNQFNVIQQDNNINEDDTYTPMLVGEKKKKKNKEKQIEQERDVIELSPKLKFKKNLKSKKKSQVQNIVPKQDTVVTEAWNEAREAIRAAEIRLKTNKELKKRKRSKDDENDVETRNVKIKEKKKFVPSSMDSVKRLPSDVIENLSDIPKKKKRKFLREEQTTDSPKKKKPKATTAKNDSEVLLLDVPGSSTQFSVINMQKAKKQPLRGAAAVASIREKMLARNNREPVSAYLMYLEKQLASKKSSKHAF